MTEKKHYSVLRSRIGNGHVAQTTIVATVAGVMMLATVITAKAQFSNDAWTTNWTAFCNSVSAAKADEALHEALDGKIIHWEGTVKGLRAPVSKKNANVTLSMPAVSVTFVRTSVIDGVSVGIAPTDWPDWKDHVKMGDRVLFEATLKRMFPFGPVLMFLEGYGEKKEGLLHISLANGRVVKILKDGHSSELEKTAK